MYGKVAHVEQYWRSIWPRDQRYRMWCLSFAVEMVLWGTQEIYTGRNSDHEVLAGNLKNRVTF
jgi:hypothetical protein